MVNVKIAYEYDDWFPEQSDRDIKELKTFAKKIKKIFKESKAPGKSLIRTIYVTLIVDSGPIRPVAGTAHLRGGNSFTIGKYIMVGKGTNKEVVPLKYSGDNGAMIGWTGILRYLAEGGTNLINSQINPKERMDQITVPWRGSD